MTGMTVCTAESGTVSPNRWKMLISGMSPGIFEMMITPLDDAELLSDKRVLIRLNDDRRSTWIKSLDRRSAGSRMAKASVSSWSREESG